MKSLCVNSVFEVKQILKRKTKDKSQKNLISEFDIAVFFILESFSVSLLGLSLLVTVKALFSSFFPLQTSTCSFDSKLFYELLLQPY